MTINTQNYCAETEEQAIESLLNSDRYNHLHSGKVRETFENPDNPEELIVIATNRVSTHDVVHKNLIPGKGKALTTLSKFWFQELKKNKFTANINTQEVENPSWPSDFPEALKENSIIVKKLKPLPIEAIIRGYLYGSALKGYDKQTGKLATGEFIGTNLLKCSKFEAPRFTPSTKSDSGDININFEDMIPALDVWLKENGYENISAESLAKRIEQNSIIIYNVLNKKAEQKGVILGDTKLEWALDKNGELHLIDEVGTGDSSRFWEKKGFKEGEEPESYDKQPIRDEAVKYWKNNPDKNGKFYDEEGFEKYSIPLSENTINSSQKRYDQISRIFLNLDPKLIIALDNLPIELVEVIMKAIEEGCEDVSRILVKFNDQASRVGANGINKLLKSNPFSCMLDPKIHDIPPTAANVISQLEKSGVTEQTEYITIHSSGGADMIQATVEAKKELKINSKILAVTVLTTLGEDGAQASFDETAKHGVLKFAKMALENGADGIVCSPLEAPILRAVFGEKYPNFEIVTPGIRFSDSAEDHQTRKKTPGGAIAGGSTDLVVGSDILKRINDEKGGEIDNERMISAINRFFSEIDGIIYEAEKDKYEFERLLYTGSWEELLTYIGAFYNKPEGGKYCRLASGLLSDGYVNIGTTERNYLVVEKAARDMASQLKETLGLDEIAPDKIDETMSEYVVIGAQMGSVRLSGVLAEKMGIETSIYTEKSDLLKQLDKQISSLTGKISDIELTVLKGTKEILENNSPELSNPMEFKRHAEVNLKGKKVILSEDIVTKGSTLKQMIQIVEDAGGEVVAIACVGNRYGKDEFYGIPLISCYQPEAWNIYYDDKTPEDERANYSRLPEGSKISEKPKDEWPELIDSTRQAA